METHGSQNIRLKKILWEKELWLLLLIICLFFIQPLLLGKSFFFRDIHAMFLPQKRLLQEFLKAGEWPLWETYLHGGHPYFAAPTNQMLYPFNLLYLFLPLITAFNVSVVLHFFLCAASSYLFARVIGFSSISAMIVGVAYTFCGLNLSLVNFLNTFFSSAYIPLLFLCWHLFLSRRQQRWFILAVSINALRIFPLAPELYAIGALLLAGWTFCFPYPLFRTRSKIILWTLLNLLAFGVSAIQLVPVFEMMSQSARGEGLSYYTFSLSSLSPWRFPESIVPQFSGYINRLAAADYWGRGGLDEDMPTTMLLSVYWGGSLVFLAIRGGLISHDDSTLPKTVRRFFLAIIVLATLLATGRYLPFFEYLYQYVPFIKIFRFPPKFLWFNIFPMAILAGYAVECQWGRIGRARDWKPSRRLLVSLWSGVAVLALGAFLWAYSPTFSEGFHQMFFKRPAAEVSQQGLFQGFLHTLTFWTLLTLAYQYRRYRRATWLPALLCGIILLDLLIAGKAVNPTTSKDFFTDTPQLVGRVKQHLNGGRLYRTSVPRNPVLYVPENRIVWGERWGREILEGYGATMYNVPVIFHDDYDGLGNIRLVKVRDLLERLPWAQKVPLLSAAGVSVILTDEEFVAPGIEYLGTVPNASNFVFHLYRNQNTLKPAQFVDSWEYVDSFEAAVRAALNDGFDPSRHVVLQRDDERSEGFWFWKRKTLESAPPAPTKENGACQASTEIRELHSTSSLRSLSIHAACDGYVAFRQAFYPGWHAHLDGESATLLRANLAFSALFIPQGEHHIALFYAPLSFPLGLGISVASLGLLVLGAFFGVFRRIE